MATRVKSMLGLLRRALMGNYAIHGALFAQDSRTGVFETDGPDPQVLLVTDLTPEHERGEW